MCTVSFVATNDTVIITSNRDEKVIRPSAIPPKKYHINGKDILFPKDPKAGGTWFAVDENSNVLVLLNGAEEKHILKEKYNRSRGLIVLELIGEISPLEMWQTIDLENVEPFTLVLFEDQKLYQLRWNEIEKTTLALDVTKNHIWSSSTLYSAAIREKRANWFNTFLDTKPEVNEAELFNFHRYTEEENTEHGLVINRNDALKTLSITQAVVEKNKVQMSHYDLMKNDSFNHAFIII